MSTRNLVASLVVLCLAVTAGSEPLQNSTRSTATEVSVCVQVFGSDGSGVMDLTKEDFSILRDGKPQLISSFDSLETPMSILLLIDRNESLETRWATMGPAIQQLFSALRPKDRLTIAAFFDKPKMLGTWTTDQSGQLTNAALDSIRDQLSVFSLGFPMKRGVDGSPQPIVALPSQNFNPPEKDLYGSLTWTTAQALKLSGRKAIIVFTDSWQPSAKMRISTENHEVVVDSENDGGFQAVLRTVIKSEIPYYFLTLNTDMNPPGAFPFDTHSVGAPRLGLLNMMQIRSRLDQLAHSSGGESLFPKRPEDVGGLWKEIVRELGTSYRLSYRDSGGLDSTSSGKVEIRVRGDGLRVRRTGVPISP